MVTALRAVAVASEHNDPAPVVVMVVAIVPAYVRGVDVRPVDRPVVVIVHGKTTFVAACQRQRGQDNNRERRYASSHRSCLPGIWFAIRPLSLIRHDARPNLS